MKTKDEDLFTFFEYVCVQKPYFRLSLAFKLSLQVFRKN